MDLIFALSSSCLCVTLIPESTLDLTFYAKVSVTLLFFIMVCCFALTTCNFKKMIEVGRLELMLKITEVWERQRATSLILKTSIVGLFNLDESEDEDDLLQRTGNFLSTSASLPRGILKVRVGEVCPAFTQPPACFSVIRV